MFWLNRKQLGDNLQVNLLTTGTLVLLVLFLVQLCTQFYLLRSGTLNNLTVLADGLARNALPALLRADAPAAGEILAGLSREPHIRRSQLFDHAGQLLASYRDGSPATELHNFDLSQGGSYRLYGYNELVLLQPVISDREVVGYLGLQRQLIDLQQNLVRTAVIWASISLLAWLFLLRIHTRFKQIVYEPLEGLNQTMMTISAKQNYAVRVTPESGGVFGRLMLSFNEMLARIEQRDDQLTQYRERMEHLAHHDALTNLPNRLLLDDRLKKAVLRTQRFKRDLALMFLDLDRFKYINDTLGHDVGDMILIEVARRLEKTLRKMDTVARLGGDEFVIIVEDFSDRENVTKIAQKIHNALAEVFLIFEHQLNLTVSIGIAFCPRDGLDLSTLKRCADIAMYQAKDDGRDNYRIYQEEMGDAVQRRAHLGIELREALESQQMTIYFQPQVSMKTGCLIGAEALLRWDHPERGLVPPDQFIYLAEESGMILKLGEWVLRETCRQARAWLDRGLGPLTFAVNVSSRQFHQSNLIEIVRVVLAETGFPPELLELELTETAIMADVEGSIVKMKELKEMGLSLSVDDFGSGYSSLSYLKHFPIDKIKIDREFVKDLTLNRNDRAIAAAMASLARIMGLEILAEGVEIPDQEKSLLLLGIEFSQGYLYAEPLTISAFEEYFSNADIQTKARLAGGELPYSSQSVVRQLDGVLQKPPVVLVVSLNRLFLEQVFLILNRMSFDVIPLNNTLQLMAFVQAINPDLILFEVTPNELNQLEKTRVEKKLFTTPLVIVVKSIDAEVQKCCDQLGCSDVLTLPLRAGDVYKAMGRCQLFKGPTRTRIRASYNANVEIVIDGQTTMARATTLSEGGIFIAELEPLDVGANVRVRLFMESGGQVEFEGEVLYSRARVNESSGGVAIKFHNLHREGREMLHAKVSDLLIGDIVREQEIPFFVH